MLLQMMPQPTHSSAKSRTQSPVSSQMTMGKENSHKHGRPEGRQGGPVVSTSMEMHSGIPRQQDISPSSSSQPSPDQHSQVSLLHIEFFYACLQRRGGIMRISMTGVAGSRKIKPCLYKLNINNLDDSDCELNILPKFDNWPDNYDFRAMVHHTGHKI